MNDLLSSLFADLMAEQKRQHDSVPPVDRWNPPLCGDMDLTICRNGAWVHEGREIERTPLIKLFSSVLKKEGEDYFLVTPVEKWRIVVEDAPFHVTAVERQQRQGQQALVFHTSTGDTIIAGPDNPLWVETDSITGEPSPYLLVRSNLNGLLNRPVFYELAEWSIQQVVDNLPRHGVESLGMFFPLEG